MCYRIIGVSLTAQILPEKGSALSIQGDDVAKELSRKKRLHRHARALVGAVVLGSLAGCGPILQQSSTPQQLQDDAQHYAQQGYLIQTGDQILVRHLIDADYDALANVAPDGRITVPGILSPIKVSGRTVEDVHAELVKRYHEEAGINSPSFALDIKATGAPYVYVSGEVERPGYLDVGAQERTVLQVIAAAGGWLPTARRCEVLIVRQGADGQQLIFAVNMDKVMDGTDLSQNVLLRPRDTVLVPPSDVASFDRWIDQHIRQALPVPGSASVQWGYGRTIQ
jgi:protein involved in polysaccharide export with SLBB domain